MTLDSDFCKINEEMVKTLQKIKKQKENKTESYLKFFDNVDIKNVNCNEIFIAGLIC